ncbi:hypothetical protein LPJ75_004822, partial [Coemansia sp. RSA 2598]
QAQQQKSDAGSSGEGSGNQSDTPVAEAPESRKRNRLDTANAGDIRLQVPAKLAETSDDGLEDADQVMADASETPAESEEKEAEADPDAIDETEEQQQQDGAIEQEDGQQAVNVHHHIREQARQNGEHGGADSASEIHDLEERIGYCLRTFDEAPFTIQRIAELLAWPERHYRSVIKFLRAVERVVYVTSTVDEFPTTTKKRPAEEDEMPMETSDGSVHAPSSLGSAVFQASPDDGVAKGPAANVSANGVVMTKAVAAKVPTAAEIKARVPETSGNASHQQQQQQQKQQQQVVTGVMPLDASDTGILHITPTSMDDTEVLKSKIQNSVDVNVPVFIDDHDGGSSKLTVQPVFPRQDGFGLETLVAVCGERPVSMESDDSGSVSESSSGADSDGNAESGKRS